MKFLKSNKASYALAAILILGFFTWKFTVKKNHNPILETAGNQIISDGKPIRLQGVVSDYFRYDFNRGHSGAQTLQKEFKDLQTLKKFGINTVGLYLSDFSQIKENVTEL